MLLWPLDPLERAQRPCHNLDMLTTPGQIGFWRKESVSLGSLNGKLNTNRGPFSFCPHLFATVYATGGRCSRGSPRSQPLGITLVSQNPIC